MMTTQPSAPHPEPRPAPSLSTARIETLADGVFAIVMTLLVFGIVVPAQEQVDELGLVGALLTLIPNLVSYFISFVILGVFWVGHHNQFFYIKRSDRTLLWINIVFMMFVALVPFSAGLLSRYGSEKISVIIYDVNLILCGLTLYWHWMYGTRDNHLTHIPVEPHVRQMVVRRILFPPALYLISIALSFVRAEISIVLDILIPILYVLPTNLDKAFRR
jgi:uncharacterized membrane protein